MCGRTACTLAPQRILQQTKAQNWVENPNQNYQPSYNAPPSAWLPVILSANKQRVLHVMKWGLIPAFATEPTSSFHTSNARCESVLTKTIYKRIIHNKRCVAVCDGYYEWNENGNKKQPYYIKFKDDSLMYVAAIYDCWKRDSELIYSYSVLTREVIPEMAWLHHRMPLILTDETIDNWLNQDSYLTLLEQHSISYDLLNVSPVSTLVNYTKNNSEDCIKPIKLVNMGITKFFVKSETGPSLPPPIRVKTEITPKLEESNVKSESCHNNSDGDECMMDCEYGDNDDDDFMEDNVGKIVVKNEKVTVKNEVCAIKVKEEKKKNTFENFFTNQPVKTSAPVDVVPKVNQISNKSNDPKNQSTPSANKSNNKKKLVQQKLMFAPAK